MEYLVYFDHPKNNERLQLRNPIILGTISIELSKKKKNNKTQTHHPG